MGICYWDAKVLWDAKARGASFGKVLTVGRQALNLHPHEVRAFRASHAKFHPEAPGILQNYTFYGYVEPFLREGLRADHVDVMDYSDYEGATILQDLNVPVSPDLHGKYDAVIDGGSLEHIFNFPVAVSNLMNMTAVGGRTFLFLPANNLCGHGFYQFSPELMFRVFSEQNGFEIERIVLWEAKYPGVELTPGGMAFEVEDPEKVRSRVGLISNGPVTMIVQARKTKQTALFTSSPFQSDYSAIWKSHAAQDAGNSATRSLALRIWKALPQAVRVRVKGWRQKRVFSFSNRAHYRPLSPGLDS
jgi:hypothetical protein